jgi:hypothetical protein
MTERNQGQSKKKVKKKGENERTEMERCLLLCMKRGDCTK